MKRIITAVILIPIVLWIVFAGPIWVMSLICGLVAFLAQEEYCNIIEKHDLIPLRNSMRSIVILAFGSLAAELSTTNFSQLGIVLISYLILIILSLFSFPFLMVIGMRFENLNKAFPSVGLSWLSGIYISIPLLLLTVIRSQQSGIFWVAFILFTVWAGDIFAMYTGKAIGKHKLALKISPGKTWEGTIGSIIGSLLIGNAWFYLVTQQTIKIDPPDLLLIDIGKHDYILISVITFIANIASQFGDLVESMLKRGVDIKDSGNTLPGHGGILDRIDALLFAVPAVFLFTLK